jgi:hypothetical protein
MRNDCSSSTRLEINSSEDEEIRRPILDSGDIDNYELKTSQDSLAILRQYSLVPSSAASQDHPLRPNVLVKARAAANMREAAVSILSDEIACFFWFSDIAGA